MRGKSRGIDQSARFDGAANRMYHVMRRLDIDSNNLAAKKKLRSSCFRVVEEELHKRFKIDNTDRRNEDAAHRLNRRDTLDPTGRQHDPKGNLLLPALRPHLPQSAGFTPQSRANTAVWNGDKHARSEQLDPALLRVANDQPAAFTGQFGFERTRNFVESRVDDTAVES